MEYELILMWNTQLLTKIQHFLHSSDSLFCVQFILLAFLKTTAYKSQITGCNFYFDTLKDRFIDFSVMLINYATSSS
jgi:hypothetical protein